MSASPSGKRSGSEGSTGKRSACERSGYSGALGILRCDGPEPPDCGACSRLDSAPTVPGRAGAKIQEDSRCDPKTRRADQPKPTGPSRTWQSRPAQADPQIHVTPLTAGGLLAPAESGLAARPGLYAIPSRARPAPAGGVLGSCRGSQDRPDRPQQGRASPAGYTGNGHANTGGATNAIRNAFIYNHLHRARSTAARRYWAIVPNYRAAELGNIAHCRSVRDGPTRRSADLRHVRIAHARPAGDIAEAARYRTAFS